MKTISARNTTLALLGLAALTAYILACTSFSPDDKKVLYPAFDKSGAIGAAIYDRETHRSRLLFVPAVYGGSATAAEPALVRPEWLPDGRRVLVGWAGADDQSDSVLQLAVVPVDGPGTVRVFTLDQLKEPQFILSQPLPLARESAFVMANKKTVLRLNLQSGLAVRHEFADLEGELALYASQAGEGVYYIYSPPGSRQPVFGRLDPERFTLTPLATITNEVADGSFFAFDRQGSRIAFVQKGEGEKLELVVLNNGQPGLRKRLPFADRDVGFANAVFAPDGDWLYAGCQRRSESAGKSDFALLEIPLQGTGSIRETTLIRGISGTDNELAYYFQIACSHDGKTAAVASTYLAVEIKESEIKPEQCALFLVDLSSPERKVTTVPIPLPERPTKGK